MKTTPAVAGDNLVTNIDTGLQQVVDNALASQIMYVRRHPRPRRGQAAAGAQRRGGGARPPDRRRPRPSSFPYYNPNVWVGGISQANYTALQQSMALNDYSIDGELPPGSTFKLTTATAALQTGLIIAGDHRRRQRHLHGTQLQRVQLHVARRHRRRPFG